MQNVKKLRCMILKENAISALHELELPFQSGIISLIVYVCALGHLLLPSSAHAGSSS